MKVIVNIKTIYGVVNISRNRIILIILLVGFVGFVVIPIIFGGPDSAEIEKYQTPDENYTYTEATYVCEDCGKSKSASEMYSIAGDVDGKTECKECQAKDDKKALEGFNS